MTFRRPRRLRLVQDGEAGAQVITSRGRPRDKRGIAIMPVMVRLLTLGWGVAVVAALVDTLQAVPQIPLLTAFGMTGLLVIAIFILTREGVPDWRGDVVTPHPAAEGHDGANDLLTELPTFNYFQRRLAEEFNRSRRMGKTVSVVLVDVNNLTAVNKEYGVRAGDEVLRHVARAAESTKRYHDVVARLGDDEFGVLLMDCNTDGVRAFIERLDERLARDSAAAEVNGRAISLWAAVCSGSATSDPTMTAPETVLQAAMASLNAAKQERERRRRMWLSA